jgi:hypothetical protein
MIKVVFSLVWSGLIHASMTFVTKLRITIATTNTYRAVRCAVRCTAVLIGAAASFAAGAPTGPTDLDVHRLVDVAHTQRPLVVRGALGQPHLEELLDRHRRQVQPLILEFVEAKQLEDLPRAHLRR